MRLRITIFVFFLAIAGIGFQGAKLPAQEVDAATVSVDAKKMMAYLAREAERLDQEAFQRVSTREKLNSGENFAS